jgi:hypothetical protein
MKKEGRKKRKIDKRGVMEGRMGDTKYLYKYLWGGGGGGRKGGRRRKGRQRSTYVR